MFGSLLKVRNQQERRGRLTNRTARRGQPFLESLETRALLSILTTSPRVTNTDELAVAGLAENVSIGAPSDHQGSQHNDQGNGPGDGLQDGPSGKKNVSVATETGSQVGIQPGQLDIQLAPLVGGSQGDKQQGQDGQNSGQGDSPGDQGGSQSDGGNGQSDGSQDGSNTNGQGANPGDQGGSQSDGGNGQSDRGNGSQGNGQTSIQGGNSSGEAAPGTNAPSDTRGSSLDQPRDATKNSRPDSQGNPEKATLDTSHEQTTSGAPAVPGIGTGENAPPTGQTSAPDRKLHGSSSGSVSEGEPRSPVGAQDGKQHGPSGLLMSDEELHILVSQSSQEPEQSNRNQAVAPSQQQNVPMEERVAVATPHQRLIIEEESSPRPAEEIITSVVAALLEPMTPETNHSYVSPQNHGLLTDSLALDFSSLRSEVQSFFELLDNLGGHPSEKQIGVLLSSGAVVVAAAMACEVARRQARRPTRGSPFALVPKLEFASEADAPSGTRLPNFGQFSALR